MGPSGSRRLLAERMAEVDLPEPGSIRGVLESLARARDRGAVPVQAAPSRGEGVEGTDACRAPFSGRRMQMLGWALVFLVVALIAGLLGFTGLAVASAGIAQILFYIFVVLFVVSSLIYLIRGRAPPTV